MSTAPVPPKEVYRVRESSRLKADKKRRKYTRCLGLVPDDTLVVYSADVNSCDKALKERVFYVLNKTNDQFENVPLPLPKIFDSLTYFRDTVIENAKSALGGVRPTPLSDSERVARSPPTKRKLNAQCARSLKGMKPVRKSANVKTFIKYEKLKKNAVPRVISPRSPEYAFYLGKYIVPLEKLLFESVAVMFNEPVIMKGYNAHEIGSHLYNKWMKYGSPVAFGLDATRFDQHVSVDALRYEHGFYTNMYVGSDRLDVANLLSWQLHNVGKCFTDDGYVIDYAVNGTRCSGDMNTSLGNCLLMCAMVHKLLQQTGVKASLLNNGDDCVIICEQKEVSKLIDVCAIYFKRYGFNIKIESPVDVLEQVEFCQTRPVCLGPNNYVMVRDPLLSMKKDTTMLQFSSDKLAYHKWLYCVAEGGKALCDGVPVLQEFYRMLSRHSVKPKNFSKYSFRFYESGFSHLANGLTDNNLVVSDGARFSFYQAFGITPHRQLLLEAHLRELILGRPGPGLSSTNYFSHLIPSLSNEFQEKNL
jgi:hypothetical protein